MLEQQRLVSSELLSGICNGSFLGLLKWEAQGLHLVFQVKLAIEPA